MIFANLNIEFGIVNLWLWLILFVATLLYEYLTIACTYLIVKRNSIAVANISFLLNLIGMGSVFAYTGQVNNGIPILAAVYIGNYWAVEAEKKKEEKKNGLCDSL
jgi:CHASE2 domain-containing sensor protein